MTAYEFEYIKRAVVALEGELSLAARIKIERTASQILAQSADRNEKILVDNIDNRLYNSGTVNE